MKEIEIRTEQLFLHYIIDLFNKRIRVLHMNGSVDSAIEVLEKAVKKDNIEKLIIYAKREFFTNWLSKGFQLEAMIDRYFSGTDAYIFTKYYTSERRTSTFWMEEETILHSLVAKFDHSSLPQNYSLRLATVDDADQLAELYKTVFAIYPTPMDDPYYIQNVMLQNTLFACITEEGKIVSAASAEIDRKNGNAEITDCATYAIHRKKGLMKVLITFLEKQLMKEQIFCTYSIARALSFGMNNAFYQLGYQYRGRLTNNCYIFDKLEDMNMWVKNLAN
ncbi:putative beta-lysine N-acetyltransferase [Bacillus kwashiorkori]|uniref:putative beta-lysine N-acetyltransferase n=1 Tax=Bacillus kwashiorkori TaxID=1522318 RepID=UPI000ADAD38B|nr:putative beta-lysine N-acetyltransferase [Bacillus kwashiorkori]